MERRLNQTFCRNILMRSSQFAEEKKVPKIEDTFTMVREKKNQRLSAPFWRHAELAYTHRQSNLIRIEKVISYFKLNRLIVGS